MTFNQAHRAIKRAEISIIADAVPASIGANASNQFGWTLLMLAAIEGNTRIGKLLLDRGANVAALNHWGESALSLAAHRGHLPFVKLLKSFGATKDVRPHGYDLENWLRTFSGLPQTNIDAILGVL